MSVTMIGLDTAKTSFQVHGVNEAGRTEVRRKLRRSEVVGFFETQPACTVVLEACSGAALALLPRRSPLLGAGADRTWAYGEADRTGGGQAVRETGQERRR